MTAEELQRLWESQIVGKLRPVAAGLFRDATVLAHERNVVTVRLSEGVPLAQARRRTNEVEPILSELLDQTARLEVSDAGGESSPVPIGGGEAPISPPGPAEAVSPAASPANPPAANAPTGSTAQQPEAANPAASARTQGIASSAASQEAKLQRIVDHFPGSVVVRDDESAT